MKTSKANMLKKLKILLGAVCLILLCAGLAACKSEDKLAEFDALVYYDAGGTEGFFGNPEVTIVDGFKFSNFQSDENGDYHFKLVDPMSETRRGDITLTKEGSFCVGWYKTRTEHLDEDGNFVDEQGRSLVLVDGVYYVKGTEEEEKPENRIRSTPYYTYSDRWDFDNDEFVCNPDDDVRELHLYAGWVPDFTFEYYYKDGESWKQLGTTNCKINYLKELTSTDKTVAYLPQWSDGKMEHTRSYDYDQTKQFVFPSRSGYTFKAAYLDEQCTQQIDEKTVHTGTIDYDNALAVNGACKIYVEFDEGERYRISTVEQLIKNASTSGYYEILNDLTFTAEQSWPSSFIRSEFKGKFIAANGNVTISGATANFSGIRTTKYGGLFGKIGANAEIKGITFKGAKLYVNSTTSNEESALGLFSGEIDAAAHVEDVAVDGAIYLGNLTSESTITLNMLVGGENKSGVTCASDGIELWATGEQYGSDNSASKYYQYRVDAENTAVDPASGDVTIVYKDERDTALKEKIITTWTQSN